MSLATGAPHVDDALHAEASTHSRRRHPVLPPSRFGDDTALADALRQKGLSNRVVDLVRARVGEVLALKPDLRTSSCLLEVDGLRCLEGSISLRGLCVCLPHGWE